jgi:hypothetical protein
MFAAPLLAQSGFDLPQAGGGEIVVWLLLAAGIVGLFLIINRWGSVPSMTTGHEPNVKRR